MKTGSVFLILLILSCTNNQSSCDKLMHGSFELFENDVLIGKLYRKDSFQIEEYLDKETYTIGRFKQIEGCVFLLKHNEIKKPTDTITWSINYIPLDSNIYEINARAAYIDTLKYVYRGKLVKTANELPPHIKQLIDNQSN